MTDAKATDKEDRPHHPVEKQPLKTPDEHVVQNANAQQLQAALKANLDHHSGSAGGNDAESIQIHMGDGRIASRLSPVTEKTTSIGLNDLLEKQEKEKDPVACSLVGEFEQLLTMRKGPAKDVVEAQLQDKADRTYGRGQYALQQPTGQPDQINNPAIKDYNDQVTEHENGKVKALETGVQYQVDKPLELTEKNMYERIGALPLNQQAQVLGAAIKAFDGELTHQQFRIGVGAITGLGDGIVGLAEGAESLGKAVIGVAQFTRDVMANDPAAGETAAKAGESLGKLMVGGVRVFSAANDYVESVGAAGYFGDYAKPLRDIAWLGQQMNNRWESMSPEEKTRLATKLAVENLGGIAGGVVVNRLAKSIDIAGALEDLGQTAKAVGSVQREKYGKLIADFADELSPKLATDTGAQLKWSEVARPLESDAEQFVSKMSYFKWGVKKALKGGSKTVSEMIGLPEKQLTQLVKEDPDALERLTDGKLIYMEKEYRDIYLEAHPQYMGIDEAFEVHHRIPQDLLTRHPDWFSHKVIHNAENLVGIPRGNGVHDSINIKWKEFWKDHPSATKEQVLHKVTEIDTEFGARYLP
jgi:hypothetical protein